MSYYCDACHTDDALDCGGILAAVERVKARAARSGGREWTAVQHDAQAAEYDECGCACRCHEPVVDQPATAPAGGGA